MGTRSTIAMKTPEGKVRAIYCHWDGYVSGNGKILLENYTTPAKVKALIDLGDISSLKPEIGEQHTFEKHQEQPELAAMFDNWTLAYCRDRGEAWTNTAPQTFDTIGEWADDFDMGVEYIYLFDGKDWIFGSQGVKDANGFQVMSFLETAVTAEAVA